MAVDKLVDSSKLNAALDYEASKIIAKGGGTAPLAFDFANEKGFGDYIDAIPSGGEDTLKNRLHRNAAFPADTSYNYGDFFDDTLTNVPDFAFYRCTAGFGRFSVPNATSINQSAFYLNGDWSPTVVFAPKATLGASCFYGCNALKICVSKAAASANYQDLFRKYSGNLQLEKVDFTAPGSGGITNRCFDGADQLSVLILRSQEIYPLRNIAAFSNSSVYTGGAGGTIYIPKALYDHLGDGTALDYKAATNWSTINGYGTITWAKIEGSIYENAYADGTPIT